MSDLERKLLEDWDHWNSTFGKGYEVSFEEFCLKTGHDPKNL